MKGKPVRFGYKEWCRYSSTGYLYQSDIYTGKSIEKVGPRWRCSDESSEAGKKSLEPCGIF